MRFGSLLYSWLGLSTPGSSAPSTSLAVFSSNASSSHHLQTRGVTWNNLGCVTDGPARALTGDYTTSPSMSVEYCQSYCFSSGYLFAGTEFGNECYCGNTVSNGLGVSTSSSSCSVACAGNSGETCGGNSALNLYQASMGSSGSTSKWVSLGCYTDASSRALNAEYADSLSMTMEWCQNYCLSYGYTYAGVEYAEECMCGSSITTGSGQGVLATDGRCNMGCLGNTAEECGGTWAINIWQYQTVTQSSGWTSLGCYVDASNRALNAMYADSLSMTKEWCQNYCLSSGFIYAGVEYAEECMCGNSITTGSGQGVLATDGRCNIGCLGNAGEQCGGTWGINIWVYGDVSTSSSTATTVTTTATSTTSTTTAPSTTTTSSFATPTFAGWTSLGCYVDASNRALNSEYADSLQMTLEICQSYCLSNGYSYAGVEYAEECMCGSSIQTGSGQGVLATDGRCNMGCKGNPTEQCGGTWGINIWKYTGTTSTSPSTATPTPSGGSNPAWVSLGCRVDVSARALSATSTSSSSMTVKTCQNWCASQGYLMAGVENGNECYCGNDFTNNGGGQAASSDCSTPCAGSSTEICGGGWRLSVYTLSTAASVTSVASSTTTTSTTSTTSSSTATPSLTTGLTTNKVVIAHHMVGNTFPYSQSSWAADIALAQSSGIDAFALNYGSDYWEPGQLSSAYAAAVGTGFKLFLSADMTALPGGSDGDAQNLANQVRQFAGHPNQLYYNGGLVFSTFSGETTTFGQGSVQAGWQDVLNKIGVQVTFMPSFFVDPSTFGNYPFVSGAFNWNGGWPSGDSDVTYGTDQQWINGLNGKLYMAAVSPNFFTHYSYKNFLYKNDDNLFATRWEMLIANRNQIAMTEIISWNDYGESHYVGPIEGAMPDGTTWVNGFPHTAWLDMNNYYSFAFKYGFYPTFTNDKVYIYGRPHPAGASACCDGIGQPNGYNWEEDNFYVVVFATSSASLVLSTPPSGSGASPTSGNANPTTVNVNVGINKFSHSLAVGSGMRATLYRNNVQVIDVNPSDYTFISNPQTLNYNVYVAIGSS
ncbi:hypothetical protein DACRYDRAFT_84208 [Dacryopinax primogenitus]|uniref:WSC domain-containing protein n=1 Tax=Dacryopinax primogenitus (strain DJM 731) TaxID=1858805 RepID=M5FQN7_DACPD|nr:uncharacterized protein DACRYDRAFT_84208 [Dacryopinax primogenitus]EJT97858.1 hypothetical protein DACRYDRAFT_84208 [Dacryopinax primogenitus]